VTVDPPIDLSSGAKGDGSGAIVRVPRHVVYRSLANETAGMVLSALEAQPEVELVVARLAGELDVEHDRLRSDVQNLIERLAAEGLLELEANDPGPAGTT
jgi:hypothetical protein